MSFDPAKAVKQTIFLDDEQGRMGNCLQAVVASALGTDLDEVPHFVDPSSVEHDMGWWYMLLGYLAQRRLWVEQESRGTWKFEADPDALYLVTGRSHRGAMHVVLHKGVDMVWDPHPDGSGLTAISEVYRIVPLSLWAVTVESAA